MTDKALTQTDQEAILDVIELAERSFGAELSPVYDTRVSTLGDFIDLMHRYTPGESATDCTTQQAFYRLRTSLAIVSGANPDTIRPDTALADLIPLANRRQVVAKLDYELGITTDLLVLKSWLSMALAIILFVSLACLVPGWPYSAIGVCAYGLGVWWSYRTTTTLSVKTVGQLAWKISREHYRAIRRNATTVNHDELESLLFDLFSHELSIPRHQLTRNTLLGHH